MIKRNRIKLVFASLLTVLPTIAGAVLWEKLPDLMPIHWGLQGEADNFGSKTYAVIAIPLVLLALLWICVLFAAFDKKNTEQNPKIIGLIVWLIPTMSIFVSGMMYSYALGSNALSPNKLFILLGIFFTVFGNYMPKCKPNKTIGIRIKWTLGSEENWKRTHRLAGHIWFFGGFAVMLCAFLTETVGFFVFLSLAVVLAFVPMIYSYTLHKKGI